MKTAFPRRQAGLTILELIIVLSVLCGIMVFSFSSIYNNTGYQHAKTFAHASRDYFRGTLSDGRETLLGMNKSFTVVIEPSEGDEAIVISNLNYNDCADLAIIGVSIEINVLVNNQKPSAPAYEQKCNKEHNLVTYMPGPNTMGNNSTSGTQDVF